jgi:mannose-1-phosphate guanylyltransferase/mannose-6-phosphate isomerase
LLKASVWLRALAEFRPDILETTKAAWSAQCLCPICAQAKAEFVVIPTVSDDYAAIERCPDTSFLIKMVPLNAGLKNLGAWDSVWTVSPKDNQGNAHMGDV